jgi:protein TonB
MSEATLTYQNLALRWNPENSVDRGFRSTVAFTVAASLIIGFTVSIVKLPKEERRVRPVVPERVARFIRERERPNPVPQPLKELPKPILKTLKRAPEVRAPTTKEARKAFEKAKGSGLVALSRELSGLIDTSSINTMVSGKTRHLGATASQTTGPNTRLFVAESGKGSGGVDARHYTSQGQTTRLSAGEATTVKQALLAGERSVEGGRGGASAGRGDEELIAAFDQNKGSLYAVYERARRRKPGLKGKIVFEITIAPGGDVISARIVSSELGDPEMEQSLLRRIKSFHLGAKNVKPITVTYPVEFLPS